MYSQTDPQLGDEYFPAVPDLAEVSGTVEAIRVLETGEDRERVPVLSVEFNEQGAMTAYTTYDSGQFMWRSELSYDSEDRLLQWRSRNVEGQLEWVYEYRYDDRGRPVQITEHTGSGVLAAVRRMQYHGDTLDEQAQYDGTGRLQWSRQFETQQTGLQRTWTLLFPDGGIVKHVNEYYSPQGRLIREEHSDQNNILTEEIRYAYDLYGRVRRTEVVDSDSQSVRVVEREYCDNGWLRSEERTETAEGSMVRREFDYQVDSFGNWIQRRESIRLERDDEVVEDASNLVQRQIRYF
ncbi:MAG: hypothetical protein ACLFNQ_02085 [Spirochaetaceae bacterium]